MAHITPGVNPSEALNKDSGWPIGWQPVLAEAFRRFTTKEFTKEELYPEASSREKAVSKIESHKKRQSTLKCSAS